VPEAVPVPAAEHQHHHHDAPDTSNTPAGSVSAHATHTRPAAVVVASARDCCADLDGLTLAPARGQTRADVVAPPAAVSAIAADVYALRTSPAHDRSASPSPPPAPVRSPLILRI
jgi:hypothetical protein